MTIADEGKPTIFAAMFISAVLLAVGYAIPLYTLIVVGWLGIVMTALFFFFFREPQFEVNAGEKQIVSPADGKVIALDEEVPPELDHYKTRLSIFLSILDCHVNRVPASGVIESTNFRQGKKYSAFKPKASTENQRSEIELVSTHGKMHFRQITGSVARRVVFSLEPGQNVTAGERFGVMRFGSRMDLFFEPNVKVLCRIGDKVKGGKTVIGEFE